MENSGAERQDLGRKGEDLACELLVRLGHRIIERNWRCGHLEIDIVSVADDGIHFVEVKTRCDNIQAPPQVHVNTKKQARIAAAAKSYLNRSRKLPPCCDECFFDIVAVRLDGENTDTEYIPRAYIPIYL